MPIDSRHLRSHLEDLRGRINFLRALQPDNPSYKLWLGDVIELVNVQWGLDSTQMKQLRAAMGRGGRYPEGETSEERTLAYLRRLEDLELVLSRFIATIGEPVTFFE